ncbi:FadR/GntR family transcriptional regulator [Corynebacterium pelargi]|uniref:HTH-type transcriptional regulator LutR n=1 Tax=Corynebacterium pelargi TaxID=1471400 RepID=A0A410WAX4_9CORY|nr:FadR/GntR family transcriptional regulator [Corynebacterium pelargi]QAU53099.1 HTH-type transcriptional regulator LutR [Corynebacterium pelargi]GGG74874.1 transcriptional regulator [Corynebacterium pelargi]
MPHNAPREDQSVQGRTRQARNYAPKAATPSHSAGQNTSYVGTTLPSRNPTVIAIEELIRDQNLTPGDVLPSEAALCEMLGVSRSSVREAMRTLASLDVVETRHGHGSYVGNMSLAPLVNGMVLRLTLNEELALENLSHVVDMRVALDMANAEELARYYQGQPMEKLRGIVEAMAQRFADGESFAREDFEFHEELTNHLSNPLMREMSLAFWEIHTRVVPVLGLSDPEDVEDTVKAHAKILDALHDGDPARYRELITEHYGPLRRVIEKKRAQARG